MRAYLDPHASSGLEEAHAIRYVEILALARAPVEVKLAWVTCCPSAVRHSEFEETFVCQLPVPIERMRGASMSFVQFCTLVCIRRLDSQEPRKIQSVPFTTPASWAMTK